MTISQNITANNLSTSLYMAANEPQFSSQTPCPNCGHPHGAITKFCTGCGTSADQTTAKFQAHEAPSFAQVHSNQTHTIPQAFQDEMTHLLVALTRERLFLLGHGLLFLTVHLIGIGLGIYFYVTFIGDEFTKLIMGVIPISIFNLLAFGSLPMIRANRVVIARLKEQLTYLHYKIEYRNL